MEIYSLDSKILAIDNTLTSSLQTVGKMHVVPKMLKRNVDITRYRTAISSIASEILNIYERSSSEPEITRNFVEMVRNLLAGLQKQLTNIDTPILVKESSASNVEAHYAGFTCTIIVPERLENIFSKSSSVALQYKLHSDCLARFAQLGGHNQYVSGLRIDLIQHNFKVVVSDINEPVVPFMGHCFLSPDVEIKKVINRSEGLLSFKCVGNSFKYELVDKLYRLKNGRFSDIDKSTSVRIDQNLASFVDNLYHSAILSKTIKDNLMTVNKSQIDELTSSMIALKNSYNSLFFTGALTGEVVPSLINTDITLEACSNVDNTCTVFFSALDHDLITNSQIESIDYDDVHRFCLGISNTSNIVSQRSTIAALRKCATFISIPKFFELSQFQPDALMADLDQSKSVILNEIVEASAAEVFSHQDAQKLLDLDSQLNTLRTSYSDILRSMEQKELLSSIIRLTIEKLNNLELVSVIKKTRCQFAGLNFHCAFLTEETVEGTGAIIWNEGLVSLFGENVLEYKRSGTFTIEVKSKSSCGKPNKQTQSFTRNFIKIVDLVTILRNFLAENPIPDNTADSILLTDINIRMENVGRELVNLLNKKNIYEEARRRVQYLEILSQNIDMIKNSYSLKEGGLAINPFFDISSTSDDASSIPRTMTSASVTAALEDVNRLINHDVRANYYDEVQLRNKVFSARLSKMLLQVNQSLKETNFTYGQTQASVEFANTAKRGVSMSDIVHTSTSQAFSDVFTDYIVTPYAAPYPENYVDANPAVTAYTEGRSNRYTYVGARWLSEFADINSMDVAISEGWNAKGDVNLNNASLPMCIQHIINKVGISDIAMLKKRNVFNHMVRSTRSSYSWESLKSLFLRHNMNWSVINTHLRKYFADNFNISSLLELARSNVRFYNSHKNIYAQCRMTINGDIWHDCNHAKKKPAYPGGPGRGHADYWDRRAQHISRWHRPGDPLIDYFDGNYRVRNYHWILDNVMIPGYKNYILPTHSNPIRPITRLEDYGRYMHRERRVARRTPTHVNGQNDWCDWQTRHVLILMKYECRNGTLFNTHNLDPNNIRHKLFTGAVSSRVRDYFNREFAVFTDMVRRRFLEFKQICDRIDAESGNQLFSLNCNSLNETTGDILRQEDDLSITSITREDDRDNRYLSFFNDKIRVYLINFYNSLDELHLTNGLFMKLLISKDLVEAETSDLAEALEFANIPTNYGLMNFSNLLDNRYILKIESDILFQNLTKDLVNWQNRVLSTSIGSTLLTMRSRLDENQVSEIALVLNCADYINSLYRNKQDQEHIDHKLLVDSLMLSCESNNILDSINRNIDKGLPSVMIGHFLCSKNPNNDESWVVKFNRIIQRQEGQLIDPEMIDIPECSSEDLEILRSIKHSDSNIIVTRYTDKIPSSESFTTQQLVELNIDNLGDAIGQLITLLLGPDGRIDHSVGVVVARDGEFKTGEDLTFPFRSIVTTLRGIDLYLPIEVKTVRDHNDDSVKHRLFVKLPNDITLYLHLLATTRKHNGYVSRCEDYSVIKVHNGSTDDKSIIVIE